MNSALARALSGAGDPVAEVTSEIEQLIAQLPGMNLDDRQATEALDALVALEATATGRLKESIGRTETRLREGRKLVEFRSARSTSKKSSSAPMINVG
jgi:phage shock protein A